MYELTRDIAAKVCDDTAKANAPGRGALAVEPWEGMGVIQRAEWFTIVQAVLNEARSRGIIADGAFW